MARISLMLGKNRDIKFSNTSYVPAFAAGSAADFEYPQCTVPDLTKITPVPSGSLGDLAMNALTLRSCYLLPTATITGVVLHNCQLFVNLRRNLGVNIQHAVTIASGSSVVTPTTGTIMNNIQVGTRLLVDTVASGVQEIVAVTAVTGTTFTATFANTHTYVATVIPIVNSPNSPFMAFPVNTTSASTVTSGAFTFTPVSMSNIFVGTSLYFSAGTGAAENVIVTAVTATTATATFANGHSGAYTIISSALATINFNLTTVIAFQYAPTLLNPLAGNILLAGDVITLQRVSNDATGLATPISYVEYEFVPARIGR